MKFASLRDEEVLVVLAFIFLLFTGININPQVGMYYSLGLLGYMTVLMARRKDWFLQIRRGKKSYWAAIPTAAVLLIAWGALSTTVLTHLSFPDFFSRLYTEANLPVLSADPTMALVLYGTVVPIVETFMFCSFVLVFGAKLLKVPIRWHNPGTTNFLKMLAVCAMVGAIGSLFHITVRGMSDWALMIDFLFFALSALVTFKYKQLLESMWLHILTNSVVLMVGGL
jgi:hypothetical protein